MCCVTRSKGLAKEAPKEVRAAVPKIRDMFEALSGLPTIALRTDWRILFVVGKRYLEKDE